MVQVKNSKVLEKTKELFVNGLKIIEEKQYDIATDNFKEAEKIFKKLELNEYVSACLSCIGLVTYLNNKDNYQKALSLINDGGNLAKLTKNRTAILINEFCLGNVNFGEGNTDVALIHYGTARDIAMEYDEFNIVGYIITRIKQIKNNLEFSLPITSDPLVSLVKIGRSITAQTDINVLLKVIAEETKLAIQADRCTVFMYDKNKNEIWSKVALGMDSQEIRFPADKGLAGYVVKTGDSINIADAYNDKRFNPEVDKKTGYKTKTILCMPIKNNNQEIIGAFQVLNKINGIFTKSDEDLLVAIGGSASIAIENAQLFEEQKKLYKEQKVLFESFIDTLATSIDARDKITAGHSSRVKLYSMLIVDELGMEQHDKELIEKAATLHDIGKIGIRDSVLQKDGKLTDEEYKHIQEHAKITHDILDKIHTSKDFKIITEIACSHHEKYDGTGYYRHLKGEKIPYGGRILAVADVFDAITSKRHYRDKMPIGNVINIMLKDSGTHFDKNLVNIFMDISLDKIISVFLTENPKIFKPEDKKYLKKYTLTDIHNIIQKESPTKSEIKLLNMFNGYYAGTNNQEQ